MLRSAWIGLFVCLVAGPFLTAPAAQEPVRMGDLPVTGKAGPGLEPLERAMQTIMRRHGIPGGALAIAKDGRLIFAKGFGWADLDKQLTATPQTLFGLASLSKPITALAILKLMEEGKLKLDEPAFSYVPHLRPPRGARVDPRLGKITVRQLLNHSGGWNRKVSGDPVNWSPQISRALGVPMPLTVDQFLTFMMAEPLDFDPGSQSQYSNVGYILLGRIVETTSGRPYEEYVIQNVLRPMGATTAGMNSLTRYLPGEARRYLAGTRTMLPPLQLPFVYAAGGWSASPVDMVRLLTALDGSRGKKTFLSDKTMRELLAPPAPPLQAGTDKTFPGLGFETVYNEPDGFGYFQDGNWHGMRAFMKRNKNGINWILVFNASMQPDLIDAKLQRAALQEIHDTLDRIREHPQVDLFQEFKE
jgi:N-acyl-D-amino-acid deacylase